MQNDHDLSRQAMAAKELIKALRETDDDAALAHDMIEGETGFFEAAQSALDEIDQCDMLAAGIKDMQATMAKRLSRIQGRADRLRALLDQAFQMAEIKTHQFASATISTKATPPKLIVTDEALIPSDFFEAQAPKLARADLLRALKEGRTIPGAELSNGGKTIQIRRA